MLKNFLILLVAISMSVVACQNNQTAEASGEEQHDHDGHDHDHGDAAGSGDGVHFGEVITEDGAIAFEDLLTQMTGKDSLDAKVVGTVESVCQAKGCWMNVKAVNGEEMFVQFKDYGFFMPKDIAGRQVIMQGYAYREQTSVEELRHYAEDEGASEAEIAAITEPKEELKFLASGVILVQ